MIPYGVTRTQWVKKTNFLCCMNKILHINGLMQEKRNSIANAVELHLYCPNPSIYSSIYGCTAKAYLSVHMPVPLPVYPYAYEQLWFLNDNLISFSSYLKNIWCQVKISDNSMVRTSKVIWFYMHDGLSMTCVSNLWNVDLFTLGFFFMVSLMICPHVHFASADAQRDGIQHLIRQCGGRSLEAGLPHCIRGQPLERQAAQGVCRTPLT